MRCQWWIALWPILMTFLAPIASAQSDPLPRARQVQGCWRLSATTFVAGPSGKVDAGQTILPPLIALDTVPGKSWSNEPLGFRVRSFPGKSGSRYTDGYVTFPAPTKLVISWTNGVVGMNLDLQADSNRMTGNASAWTDYSTSEHATVTLLRAPCA